MPTPVLSCRLSSVRILSNLLTSISCQDTCLCTVKSTGLQFSVDQAQSLQAHAYLQSALFRSFEFKEPEEEVEEEDQSVVSFAFQLKVLVQCLNVFGHATPALLSEANSNDHTLNDTSNQTSTDETSLKMVYVGVGEPLEIMLEDKGVVTVCRLSTFIHDTNATAIPFINPQTPISHRLIIQSAWLHAALMEADASTEIVGFALSPVNPYCVLSIRGITGESLVEYDKNSEVVEYFVCPQAANYRYSVFEKCKKALELSTKTSVRINTAGYTSLQFMIPASHPTEMAFVEFLMCPLEDYTDDD